jgi:sugar transferase (PEP-CTERM/EpsH1 system associated)
VHLLWIKTELLHPIDKGGRIRTYNMLRALKRQHHVTYLTLDNGSAAPNAAELAQEYCHELVRVPFHEAKRLSPRFWFELLANVASPLPYAIAKYKSDRLRKEIQDAVRDRGIDVVVCDFLAPSQNVPDGLPCRTVLFQHNVEAAIWRRHADVRANPLSWAYFREQWRRMERFERNECRRFDRVVAVSRTDAIAIERNYGITGVSDVPTGVDTEFFRPDRRAPLEPHNLVFTGAMDWLPNEDGIAWFVYEVLPLIHERMPDVTLTIVGRNPPPVIRELAARDQRLRVTGSVPDVRPFMESGAVFVVPLRVGGGTRLKIYEALAMERALVSTTIGAEGLPLENGVHAVIADGAARFAGAVVKLLADPQQAAALARTGASYVRENFGWDRAAERFIELLSGDSVRQPNLQTRP